MKTLHLEFEGTNSKWSAQNHSKKF